jgi:hypothetical protein
MRNTSNISAARKAEDARNRAACVPPIWSPPANPKRFGNGTTIKYGVAIPDSRPQPTVEMQSACRGYIQPHWNLQHDEPAQKLVAAFNAYFGAMSEHGYNDAKLTVSGAYKALDTAFNAYKNAVRSGSEWEDASPPDQGGKEAAPTEQRICPGLPEGERLPGGSHRVDRVPGRPAEKVNASPTEGNGSRMACPLHNEWKELNATVEAGNVTIAKTPPIPRIMSAVAEETPRQVMAKAIPRAIASIPQSWGDHDKIKLPYGFYMQRKGFDEARIYHPKHRGSIPAGFLGKGWQINPSHQLRNSLDVIESIIKRNKLDKPTPPPTSPASNPVERAA